MASLKGIPLSEKFRLLGGHKIDRKDSQHLFAVELLKLERTTAPSNRVTFWIEREISIGGKASTVKTGEMLIMPANVPHALSAKERFKMLLVMIRGLIVGARMLNTPRGVKSIS